MMNAPSSPWSAPKVSRLWSAKGDERCSPPRSDDYKDWSLSQLKREITQRQTNPRRRNKEAFVRVLLTHDQQQQATQTQNAPQNQQQPPQQPEEPVLFVPTSSSELQNMYNNVEQQRREMYGNNGPQQPRPDIFMEQSQRQQPDMYGNSGDHQQQFIAGDVNVGVMQATLTPPAPAPQVPVQPQMQQTRNLVQTPVPVSEAAAAGPDPVVTEKVNTPTSFQASKRQRGEPVENDRGRLNMATRAEVQPGENKTSVPQATKGSTEYLRRKLSIQAARLEIENRRLDLETKREQRNNELHAVQLALAQEQLQQAKMTTQKMKAEWMVEQLMQKKRLDSAGISQEDSAALGLYLS